MLPAVPLLLRPAADGAHRLRLRLEELSGADGRPSAEPAGFRARLASHRVNAPLLLLTAAAGLVCSLCAWIALYSHCRRCHVLRLEEGRARLRADLGPGLVRLGLAARYEPDWDGVLPESLGPAHDALAQFTLTVEDGVRLPWPQPVLELDPPAR
jgi:hypothetical protein